MSSVSPSSSASQADVASGVGFLDLVAFNKLVEGVSGSEKVRMFDRYLSAYHAYLRTSAGDSRGGSQASGSSGGSRGRAWSARKVPPVPAALTMKRLGSPVKSLSGSSVSGSGVSLEDRFGYCYLRAFKPDVQASVAERLGPCPTFFSLLAESAGSYASTVSPELRLQEVDGGWHLVRAPSGGRGFWGEMAALSVNSRPAVQPDSVWHLLKERSSSPSDLCASMVVGADPESGFEERTVPGRELPRYLQDSLAVLKAEMGVTDFFSKYKLIGDALVGDKGKWLSVRMTRDGVELECYSAFRNIDVVSVVSAMSAVSGRVPPKDESFVSNTHGTVHRFVTYFVGVRVEVLLSSMGEHRWPPGYAHFARRPLEPPCYTAISSTDDQQNSLSSVVLWRLLAPKNFRDHVKSLSRVLERPVHVRTVSYSWSAEIRMSSWSSRVVAVVKRNGVPVSRE